jgi:hypothetical protein
MAPIGRGASALAPRSRNSSGRSETALAIGVRDWTAFLAAALLRDFAEVDFFAFERVAIKTTSKYVDANLGCKKAANPIRNTAK